MGLFVKSSEITIDDTKIVIREIGVDYLLLSDEDKSDSKKLLVSQTSLTEEQVNCLTIEAFEEILSEFYKLNETHFAPTEEGKEEGGK